MEAFLHRRVGVSDYYHRVARKGKSIRIVAGFLETLMLGAERFKTIAELVK